MTQTILERAPAKINLTLDVLSLREDGYHELRSVMQTVSLCDELAVELGAPDWRVECNDPAVPAGEDNLILRAARAYCARADIRTSGVRVRLEKRIPMQAGLGGGSADAAACLRALQRACGALSERALLEVAASVGSDVPFCLLGGTRLCTGRGEKMEALPPLAPCSVALCKPAFSVSTPALFRAIDAHPELTATGAADAERAVRAGKLPRGKKTNRFEALLTAEHDALVLALDCIESSGAALTSLSGTGSACFGLFAQESDAARCVQTLRDRGFWAALAHPV